MINKAESIGEVFLIAWEKGLRINVEKNEISINSYDDLSVDDLLCVGWDQENPPIEEDDVAFIAQYIQFKKIYSSK